MKKDLAEELLEDIDSRRTEEVTKIVTLKGDVVTTIEKWMKGRSYSQTVELLVRIADHHLNELKQQKARGASE